MNGSSQDRQVQFTNYRCIGAVDQRTARPLMLEPNLGQLTGDRVQVLRAMVEHRIRRLPVIGSHRLWPA